MRIIPGACSSPMLVCACSGDLPEAPMCWVLKHFCIPVVSFSACLCMGLQGSAVSGEWMLDLPSRHGTRLGLLAQDHAPAPSSEVDSALDIRQGDSGTFAPPSAGAPSQQLHGPGSSQRASDRVPSSRREQITRQEHLSLLPGCRSVFRPRCEHQHPSVPALRAVYCHPPGAP